MKLQYNTVLLQMWYGFSVPFDTLYVISWTILYGSDDPANNVRALKDVRISEIKQSAIGYKIFSCIAVSLHL